MNFNKINKFLAALTIISFACLTSSKADTPDCFEKVNRAVFSFNMKLDKIIFKPVAKGYSYLPDGVESCLLYTSPSPRDGLLSRMPSSA